MKDFYDNITKSIIDALEGADLEKWEKPWFDIGSAPYNALTQKPYRGINYVNLSLLSSYPKKSFASYKQWAEKECQVIKGSKGSSIVFWSFTENEETGKQSAFLKQYTVFNVAQVTGDFARKLEQMPEKPLNTIEAIENAEVSLHSYLKRENIPLENSDTAAYWPMADKITLPFIGQFGAKESYYSTALHEATHSTGHKNRLNRDLTGGFGSENYAKEELIAELGAAMLCGTLGISQTPRPDHAQYIASWLKALKNDNRLIFAASGKAQKACDFILNGQSLEDKTPNLEPC